MMNVIDLLAWDDGEDPKEDIDVDPRIIKNVSMDVHDLPMLLHDPDKFFNLAAEGIPSTDRMSRSLSGALLASVCSEQAEILADRDVYHDYAMKLFERLDTGKDTGLAPPGGLDSWSRLTASGRKTVKGQVLSTLEEFRDAFPDPGTMNIVAVAEPVTIDWGEDMLYGQVPALAQVSDGIVGITSIPVKSEYGSADASAIMSGLNSIQEIIVKTVHVWNAESRSISKPLSSDSDDAARVMMDAARIVSRRQESGR